MQTLEIISANLWQTLISLANLTILFLLVKKFLFKPVKKMLAERQNAIDAQYQSAENAEKAALADKAAWEEKMQGANAQADAILQTAADNARMRGDKLVAEAKVKAEGIVRTAENEAALERKKAEDSMKREIAEVSAALSEKLLAREIKAADHRALIDSFLEENVGGGDDTNA